MCIRYSGRIWSDVEGPAFTLNVIFAGLLASNVVGVGCDALIVRFLTNEIWERIFVICNRRGDAICTGACVCESGLQKDRK